MNILLDDLPRAVKIAGERYALNTGYRSGLKIIMAFEDPELTLQEKQLVMLRLLYREIPVDTKQACELAVKFLNCGEEVTETADNSSSLGRLYSFTQDARYIFSGIFQTHGVNLAESPDLHWWVFYSLFMDLHEDCFFIRLVHLRRQLRSGKATKEERQWYAQIREIVDLPEVYTAEEQAALDQFDRLLRSGP